jgi:hypothetical protein
VDLPQYGSVQIMKELVPRLIGPQVCATCQRCLMSTGTCRAPCCTLNIAVTSWLYVSHAQACSASCVCTCCEAYSLLGIIRSTLPWHDLLIVLAASRLEHLGAQPCLSAGRQPTPEMAYIAFADGLCLHDAPPLLQGTTLSDIEDCCGASLIVDDGGTINVYAPTQVGYIRYMSWRPPTV